MRRCVHELVADQARATPDATALIFDGERISYRELDARAGLLAGLLVAARVGDDAVVGVYLPRGVEMVVALLAALKAGAGYAMLDPEFPAARLRDMMTDVAGTVIVSRRDLAAERLRIPATVVFIDDPVRSVGPAASRLGQPEGAACVMFTSGSTGRPKGIVAPHAAITGTLVGQEYAGFGPGSVWLQCSPVSWDAFALELWGPLVNGGTCVLHPGSRPDPVVIRRLVGAHGVTSMYLSGSLFNVIVDEYPVALKGLRELIVGGEALSPVHLARARAAWPDLRLSNGYGPVEGMIFLTVHPLAPADLTARSVPIGRPLPGKRVHLLDARLRPVPDGATGELYAAGAGLARGYAARPDLTAERFVADPAGPPGERMYRTGDLARRRPDGVLEFIGRADAQVKVRGFRVEPGEIEAVLLDHPDVERAAVVADRDATGDHRLVAYAVPSCGRTVDREVVRAFVAARLPEFMVPAAVVVLDALPLTANGKLDRTALPRPVLRGAGASEPRTELEKRLCALFGDVLGVESIGIDDDFFALGGHSLLAARLLGRMRAGLGAQVDLPTLFEAPTVAQLAPRVTMTGPASVPAAPSPDRSRMSFAQSRLWYLDRIASPEAAVAYNLPTLVRLNGTVDADALEAALADVVERHEPLRTAFEEQDGEPVPLVLDGRPALERVRVTANELPARVAEVARRRFDLSSDLPIRAVLFTIDGDGTGHALLFVIHHIAADGWSMPPLLEDLSRAYTARLAGSGTPTRPRLPVAYADHAAQQRARLGVPTDPDSLAGRQLRFWRAALADLPPSRPLPRRPEAVSAAGAKAGAPSVSGVPAYARAATVYRRLDADAHARLIALARAHRATLFMVLHAALVAVITRAGAAGDVPVAAPVAGRGTDGTVDDVVGFFVNLLVLRTDAAGDPTVTQLLDRVRDTDLAALAHQDVPFEWVVGELNPVRSPGRHPFTDVVLALQNNAQARLDLPGVSSHIELLRTGSALFDLLVDVSDVYQRGVPGGVTVTVEYATHAYEKELMEWLADAMVGMLHAMPAAPERPLSRIRLPDPPRQLEADLPPTSPGRASALPRPELERRIAAVWSEVLGVASVGADDNFFALGGNSLRAVRVAAKLTTSEGRLITAVSIFAAPTVAGLARELAAAPEASEALEPIPRRPRTPR
jgi:amino acid adenylation domain-containing protein